MDFFVSPPTHIGSILTCASTLRCTDKPVPFALRIALACIIGTVIYGGAEAMAHFFANAVGSMILATRIVVALIAALACLSVWQLTAFDHTCSFVGTLGVAIYSLRGERRNRPRLKRQILFRDVTELYYFVRDRYVNREYQRTEHQFDIVAHGKPVWTIWVNTGEIVGAILGWLGFRNRENEQLELGRSIENAWTLFLSDGVSDALARSGYVEFSVRDRDSFGNLLKRSGCVRIGNRFIELERDGAKARVVVADIASFRLQDGTFSLRHKDARWYSSSGKFSFHYACLANAKLFLLLCPLLLGFSPESQQA
jgi:hypothetical protein